MPSINHDLQVNTINVNNALPESADKYIYLTDTHNNIVFIIDTASPKSLIPSNKYTCVTNPDPRKFLVLMVILYNNLVSLN